MSKKRETPPSWGDGEQRPSPPSRRSGWGLLRKILLYHLILVVAIFVLAVTIPGFTDQLPIGGVTDLAASGDLTVNRIADVPAASNDIEIVNTVLRATNELDRLGYARQLAIVLIGVWLLMLPVSWVHKGIHQVSSYDHSLDETTLILPGVVAAIVLVVQHSLALAFSLAGIVAGVQFRRALQDTFDALFILVAIGTGIAAGVRALEIAAVLTVFFTYATLYVYFLGDGLESEYLAQRRARKRQRKAEAAAAPQPPADSRPTDPGA
ncbi:hypothetical protein [Elongatibacter sediminis]|uniref:DUF4956 domain-containing protein n=1 Tax=Elongatibacter sediminis TaxID=3119006 RepID=A0AAW9RBD0_9GAMM